MTGRDDFVDSYREGPIICDGRHRRLAKRARLLRRAAAGSSLKALLAAAVAVAVCISHSIRRWSISSSATSSRLAASCPRGIGLRPHVPGNRALAIGYSPQPKRHKFTDHTVSGNRALGTGYSQQPKRHKFTDHTVPGHRVTSHSAHMCNTATPTTLPLGHNPHKPLYPLIHPVNSIHTVTRYFSIV